MQKKKPSPEEIAMTAHWGTWEKEASEFPWHYSEKETCYILEGSATVTESGGENLEFGKGDLVEFEKGTDCTWTIHEKIVKKYKFG